MSRPFAVVFAGVPGTSKTPISNYLSWKFGLGVLNADQLRFEIREDLLLDDNRHPAVVAEFEKRYRARSEEVLSSGRPIIFDGSVDRRWPERREQLAKFGYNWFLVEMNLSLEFLTRLFSSTGRESFITEKLPKYMAQHEAFRSEHLDDVSVSITDELFPNRGRVAAAALEEFLAKLNKQTSDASPKSATIKL